MVSSLNASEATSRFVNPLAGRELVRLAQEDVVTDDVVLQTV